MAAPPRGDLQVPAHLTELVAWFVATVTPLVDENGWSVTVNGNAGMAQTDVRRTARTKTPTGETRTETRELQAFRLKCKQDSQ